MGELRGQQRPWFGGKLPELPPPDNIVGNRDCFESGAIFPIALGIPGDFVGGFPKRCWFAPSTIPVLTSTDLNINDRPTQLAIAQVIQLLYDDPNAAAVLLQTMLDRPAIITIHSSAGTVFPGILVARTNAYTVVIVGGIENELQRALAALYATLPPQESGGFSTNPYFNTVANFVASFMLAAGVDGSLPILYAGHSLGGVAVTIQAARTRQANPGADVRLVTYGTPRPGDDRLRTIIGNTPSVNLVNVGDYVSQLPPVLGEFYPLAAEVLPEFGISWVNWKDTANRQALGDDGRIVAPSALAITWPDLSAAIGVALEGAPFPPLVAHTIAEYVRRLGLE